METREIVVIGAGPAGAVASALLKRKGHDVLVLERQTFPRFLVLKRLGVPADGSWSDVYSTADFRRATYELFGVL